MIPTATESRDKIFFDNKVELNIPCYLKINNGGIEYLLAVPNKSKEVVKVAIGKSDPSITLCDISVWYNPSAELISHDEFAYHLAQTGAKLEVIASDIYKEPALESSGHTND